MDGSYRNMRSVAMLTLFIFLFLIIYKSLLIAPEDCSGDSHLKISMTMFGSKAEKQTNNTNAAPSANLSNSLVEGTHVTGNIIAPNDIRIDGTLIGNLDCSGRVIIGPQGKIEGDIKCNNAIIEGAFTGTLTVQDLLTVKDSGIVNGDITTDKLMVQTGAMFNVKCNMGNQTFKSITTAK